MSILDQDLTAIFTDATMTVAVVAGAQATRGFYDRAQVVTDMGGAMVIDREPSLLIAAGSLTGLAVGLVVLVDGRPAKVRRILAEDDGRLQRLVIAEGA